LGDIFRVLPVAQHDIHGTEQPILIRQNQFFKTVPLARLDGLKQPFFVAGLDL
jgi:hypothetical protein